MSNQCNSLIAKANHTHLHAVVNAVYRCTGDETSLSQCESTPGGGLGHERDVGVECRRPTPCSNPLVIMSMHVYMYISSPTACIAYLLYIVETVYVVKAELSVIVVVEAELSVIVVVEAALSVIVVVEAELSVIVVVEAELSVIVVVEAALSVIVVVEAALSVIVKVEAALSVIVVVEAALSVIVEVEAALSVIVEVEAALPVVPIDWFPSMFADAFDDQQS